jgi:hypothetical protein
MCYYWKKFHHMELLWKEKNPSKQKEKAEYKNPSTRSTRQIKAQEHMSWKNNSCERKWTWDLTNKSTTLTTQETLANLLGSLSIGLLWSMETYWWCGPSYNICFFLLHSCIVCLKTGAWVVLSSNDIAASKLISIEC